MTYRQQLAHEYQRAKEVQAKLEKARDQGNTAAIQVFESLLSSTWKQCSDLEKLVEIYEK